MRRLFRFRTSAVIIIKSSTMNLDRGLLNVLQVGFAFFLIFTAFQSCGVIQETVLQSVHNRNGTVNEKAGYYSLAIIYGVFMIFNFFSAAIVNLISAKWAMVIGGCGYALFLSSFLKITNSFLYSTSALTGVGAALIWVGQGQYLTKNSNEETMGRNSAIAWAIFQCSLPVGGIFLYTQFRDVDSLSDSTIRIVYLSFSCMAVAGVVVLGLLRAPPPAAALPLTAAVTNYAATLDDSASAAGRTSPQQISPSPTLGAVVAGSTAATSDDPRRAEESGILGDGADGAGPVGIPGGEDSFWNTFVSTFKLLKTLPMFLLTIVFCFMGLELTFWSGVYGTCLAFTEAFGGSSKSILAVNLIFLGLGEILAGGLFGIMGKKIHNFVGRSPIILLGMITHLLAFVLIFLNVPSDAPIRKTNASAYIEPNEYLALFCSFLLGFADSCWNTQVYSILGTLYAKNSAPAFALFKFVQSGFACASFFFGAHLTLEYQLIILSITCVFGGLAFFKVNHMTAKIATNRAEKAA